MAALTYYKAGAVPPSGGPSPILPLPDATNTGLFGIGVDPASLTPQGTISYNTPNQTITGKNFTGQVLVRATGVTIHGCQFAWGGANSIALDVGANNCIVEDCTWAPTTFFYVSLIATGCDGLIVRRCNMSTTENGVTLESGGAGLTNVTIRDNFIHDLTGADNDCIEVYAGDHVNIVHNSLVLGANGGNEAGVNIAPWNGATNATYITVTDNWIDNGITHTLVDVQSTGVIQYVKFLRNYMGGHTQQYGSYTAFQNNDARAITHNDTEQAANPGSVQWPNTGPDVNYWYNCTGLVPDQSGQIINLG